jgi:hypothetical protein
MAKKKTVITNNRQIYEKFNMLNFTPEIMLQGVKGDQINKILKSINRSEQVLTTEKIGDYILVKRIREMNFKIYLK